MQKVQKERKKRNFFFFVFEMRKWSGREMSLFEEKDVTDKNNWKKMYQERYCKKKNIFGNRKIKETADNQNERKKICKKCTR